MTRAAAFPARRLLVVAAVVALAASLAAVSALTKRPWFDEGGYANPAYNLLVHGHLGMTLMDDLRPVWPRMDIYTFSQMPLHFLAQAAWYGGFGVGVMQMRALSIVFGLLLVVGVYVIGRRISSHRLGLLAALLVGTDYHLVHAFADGRMDAMTAALGYGALAAYLTLRDRSFAAAVGVSNLLVAASGLTHPNGILYAGMLLVLAFWFDRRRLMSMRVMLLAALPYVAAAIGWALYITQDLEEFHRQFLGQVTGRTPGAVANPLGALQSEAARYLRAFGIGSGQEGLARLKGLVLAAYLGAASLWLLVPALRRRVQLGPVPLWLAVTIIMMIGVVGGRQDVYLIHVLPLWLLLAAAAVSALWDATGWRRWVIRTGFVLLLAFQIAATGAQHFLANGLADYRHAVAVIRQHLPSDGLLIGSYEFAFDFGYEGTLRDDSRLGTTTGRVPDVIVFCRRYQVMTEALRQSDIEAYSILMRRLSEEYKIIDDGSYYDIYVRETASSLRSQGVATAAGELVK